MKIQYNGSDRFQSIWETLGAIFSISYYDWDETPKAISLVILGYHWQWLVGEWDENEDDL